MLTMPCNYCAVDLANARESRMRRGKVPRATNGRLVKSSVSTPACVNRNAECAYSRGRPGNRKQPHAKPAKPPMNHGSAEASPASPSRMRSYQMPQESHRCAQLVGAGVPKVTSNIESATDILASDTDRLAGVVQVAPYPDCQPEKTQVMRHWRNAYVLAGSFTSRKSHASTLPWCH
jgi:hypothetical protein